jgi:enoyl-CoA hydratase
MVSPFRVEPRGPVAVVTMDDGKANALSPSFMGGLRQVLREAAGSHGAIVLTGRAGFFSAGLDVKLLPTLSHPERVAMVKDLAHLLLEVFLCPRPVLAAVTGHALAGGALLALACDLRLALEAPSRFGLNEVAIGLPLPTFGVEIVRTVVAPPWHTELCLHARVLTLSEARDRGIVEALHPAEALLDATIARATPLATLPTHAYEATKLRLRGPAAAVARHALDDEIDGFVRAFVSSAPGA